MSTFQACDVIGLPECELHLAHCTIFLAVSPKSNSATLALAEAKSKIKNGSIQRVPMHLRDSHNKVGKQLGYGNEYLYSHEYPEAISGQDYMEEYIEIYKSVNSGAEINIAERLDRWKMLKNKIKNEK
jgi:putative ATPase